MPIDRFVVDFACVDANFIVEIDGGQHADLSAADQERSGILESMGFLVLRFWNNDVLLKIDGVLEYIAATVQPAVLEPPYPARQGALTSPQWGDCH